MLSNLTALGRERTVLLGVWALAVIGVLLGAVHPSGDVDPGAALQILSLIRVLTTASLAVTVVLGPGLVLRNPAQSSAGGLGFAVLPGLGLLACTGCGAWLLGLAGWPHADIVSIVVICPVLAWLLVELLRFADETLLSSGERWALLVVGAALGIAVARSLWSIGPVGELYGGTIQRTLEVGDRSDPLTSYHVVQLVTQGASPFGALSRSYFLPYSFSFRGPLAGLASTPLVLLSGGHPTAVSPSSPWVPFDPQGYMSYRLAMMTFAACSMLAVWTLAHRLAGERVARLALLLTATTPFVVHEIWFTWPKLLAAALVLLSAVLLLDRRPLRAGLLLGVGYLVHPLALFSVPALGLIALWPLTGANIRRPQLRQAVMLAAALAVSLLVWRLVNWYHYSQADFVNYISQEGRSHGFLSGHPPPFTLGAWLNDRLVSIANTLVPLRLFFLSAKDQSINSAYQACFPLCSGGSPAIVHFYFQYWTGVPFGFGIVFFPMLLMSIWRAFRTWPWAVTATVLIPFVAFAVYWGDASTGLLREGLHAWVLTVIVVIAVEQGRRGMPWLRSPLVRAALCLRTVETLLVALLPTIATTHLVLEQPFRLTDLVAVAAMTGFSAVLAVLVWRERPPWPQDRSQPRERAA